MRTLCGEWSENLKVWWMGANNCEFIAWKGSHEIAVYPCDKYPNLPTHFIKGDRRIETLEDFDYTLNNGKKYSAQYGLVEELKESGMSEVIDEID